MKNLILKAKILLIALIFIFSGNANAQFGEDDVLLSLGISAGDPGYHKYTLGGNYTSAFIPPVIFQGELGIYKYVSIGAQLGYQYKAYKDYSYYHKYSNYSIGAVGAYHYSNLIQDLSEPSRKYLKQLDLYASFILRFNIEIHKSNHYYDPSTKLFIDYSDNSVKLIIGPLLGFRYYFKEQIALWSELGYGNLGVFTFGFTYKLGK